MNITEKTIQHIQETKYMKQFYPELKTIKQLGIILETDDTMSLYKGRQISNIASADKTFLDIMFISMTMASYTITSLFQSLTEYLINDDICGNLSEDLLHGSRFVDWVNVLTYLAERLEKKVYTNIILSLFYECYLTKTDLANATNEWGNHFFTYFNEFLLENNIIIDYSQSVNLEAIIHMKKMINISLICFYDEHTSYFDDLFTNWNISETLNHILTNPEICENLEDILIKLEKKYVNSDIFSKVDYNKYIHYSEHTDEYDIDDGYPMEINKKYLHNHIDDIADIDDIDDIDDIADIDDCYPMEINKKYNKYTYVSYEDNINKILFPLGMKIHENSHTTILGSFVAHGFGLTEENIVNDILNVMKYYRHSIGYLDPTIDLETIYLTMAIANDIMINYDAFCDNLESKKQLPHMYPMEFIIRVLSKLYKVGINFYSNNRNENKILEFNNENYSDIIKIFEQREYEYYTLKDISMEFTPINSKRILKTISKPIQKKRPGKEIVYD